MDGFYGAFISLCHSVIKSRDAKAVNAVVGRTDQAGLMERWRLRHAYPDAIGMWAKTTGEEARSFAFNAIAQNPRVLHRAARLQAVKMAVQAEDFALSLLQSDTPMTESWLTAARFVQQAIDAWRKSLRAYAHHTETGGGVPAPSIIRTPLRDPWETARRNFPHIDEETGLLATRVLHEFGAVALERAQRPWDHVIALAVLRYAAERLRHGASADARCEAIADVRSVLSYAETVGLMPFMVSHSGPGKPAMQALGLVHDARTLRAALREEHASTLRAAIDFHAYAVFALDHRLVLELPLQEAREIASAAVRQAERLLAGDDGSFPPLAEGATGPKLVRLYAAACQPDQSDTISPDR